MRLERMMGILLTLLNTGQTTAQALADKFEVSIRTIYRDLDALSASGLPVYAQAGRDGGVGILPSYALSRTLLTPEEQEFLPQILRDFSQKSDEAAMLSQKLSALFPQKNAAEWLRVDLGQERDSEEDRRFAACKQAILSERLFHFAYLDGRSAYSVRVVEPMTLLFRHGHCYLWAYCLQRKEFRLFRLSRMSHECVLPGCFRRREVRLADWEEQQRHNMPGGVCVQLLFAAGMENRVMDEFPFSQIRTLADGRFFVRSIWPNDAWAMQSLLSYGDGVFVLTPRSLQDAHKRQCARAFSQVEQDYASIWKEIVLMENKTTESKDMAFCQSCSMPMMQPQDHGKETDGAVNADYCHYCYDDGHFTADMSVDEMIEFCVPHVSNGNPYPNAETARAAMKEYFPQLKRWKQS